MAHQVVTRDYPENINGGIGICGIEFGGDDSHSSASLTTAADDLSFFSDLAARPTDKFQSRVVSWLSLWDINLTTEKGTEGKLERRFFQTNWLDLQNPKSTHSVDDLAAGAEGILRLIAVRAPAVMFLFGAQLIEALNHIDIRDLTESALGPRPGRPVLHRAHLPESSRATILRHQSWPKCEVFCLPHPTGSHGVTNASIATFAHVIRPAVMT